MKKKKIKKNKPRYRKSVNQEAAFETHSAIQLLSYEITYKPLYHSNIPQEVQNEMESFYEKSQRSPTEIIDRLEELITKYPKVPQLYNFISVAYSNLNNKERSKYYAEKNYQNNPDYLFAKLNYAEICMLEGNYEKVPEILDNKFDIKALYPERDVFHITEVVGFMGIAGLYFAHIGKDEQTELFYKGLKELAPDHPYTRRLRQKRLFNSLRQVFGRPIGRK